MYYGRLPGFGLSALGRRQVQDAARALHGLPVAAIYTSPQARARETAAAIQAVFPALQPVESPLLNEVYTPFDGLPRQALEARNWDVYAGTPPEYEQPADILARARQFIAQVRASRAGQHVVAATHGDVIAFLIMWVHGLPVGPQSKRQLGSLGIPRSYPAKASITALSFHTSDPDEVPDLEHRAPYTVGRP